VGRYFHNFSKENLEWQHREKMAENEVRLKDKHIHFLENQLGLK